MATQLMLLHERLDALRADMADVAKAVEPGWSSALDKLAQAAERSSNDPRTPTNPQLGGS